MKVITKYPVIIDEVNVSPSDYYSNLPGLSLNTLATDVDKYTKNVLEKNESIKNLKTQSDLKAQEELAKKLNEEKILKEKSSQNWWNKRTTLEKGFVIVSGFLLLGIGSFLVFKAINKK